MNIPGIINEILKRVVLLLVCLDGGKRKGRGTVEDIELRKKK